MRKRKGMAVIAAIVMTAVMSLGGSLAAATTSVGISDGAAAVTVNQTVVGFAGHEWWVIGDAEGGVYSQPNSVTLLSKNHNGDFGDTVFNMPPDRNDNIYKDSMLQRKMVEIASGLSVKEQGKINKRTLRESGGDVADQQLWALSEDEYKSIGSQNVRSYESDNWLRSSPPGDYSNASSAFADGGAGIDHSNVGDTMAARPALNLNVSSVIFTSNAGQTGKTAATPGGGLVSVTAPDTTGTNNKIKYTFEDDTNLKLGNVSLSKVEANKATVKYDGATEKKTLSFVVKNSKGESTHYGKLAEKINGEGEASLDITNIDLSQNTIHLFTEEINGTNESDFATTPKALNIDSSTIKQVAVTGGDGGGSYTEGVDVELTAAPAPKGGRFKHWEISPEVTPTQGTSFTDETITFTMPGEDVTATAVYEYSLTVIGGSGSNYYAQGEEVTLTADPAAAGKRFKRWEISPEVTLTTGSLTDETITFTMPGEDVTATAGYEDVYTVTVNNGSISGGIEEYAEGEEVTLTADPAPEGKYFKGWNISPEVTLKDGATVTSGIIKFDMPAHAVTATAEYEDLIVYPIKDGDNTGWTQGDQGGLIITSAGEHRKFTGVTVDGNTVDGQHYTVESGSTIVTLKASYLSTLSVGEHVMRIHFTDGYTETRFNVQEVQTDKPTPPTTDPDNPNPPVNPGEPTSPVNPPVNPNEPTSPNPPVHPGEANPPVQGGTTTATTVTNVGTSPKTGDSNRIWIMVSLMLGAGVGFMAVCVLKKRKENS